MVWLLSDASSAALARSLFTFHPIKRSLTCLRLALPACITALALVVKGYSQEPASGGTLSDYLSLPEEGVRVGTTVFSDFQLLPTQFGATPLSPDLIDVTPQASDSEPGFSFSIMDGATGSDFFQLRFSFELSGSLVESARLSLRQAAAASGSNSGTDTLADLFQPGDSGRPVESLFAFVTSTGEFNRTDEKSFNPLRALRVEFEITLDGGSGGRPGETVSSLGSISFQLGTIIESNPIILACGFDSPANYFIEFRSTPQAPHIVTTSNALEDRFNTSIEIAGGSLTTDLNGLARIDIDTSSLGPRQFFRIEQSNQPVL